MLIDVVGTPESRAGEALHTIRYGRTPQRGCGELLQRLFADVKELLAKGCLKVAVLSDGAVELEAALDQTFNLESFGIEVYRGIDFWHVVEKLGEAARIIHDSAAGPVSERVEAVAEKQLDGARANSQRAAAELTAGLPIGSGNIEATYNVSCL